LFAGIGGFHYGLEKANGYKSFSENGKPKKGGNRNVEKPRTLFYGGQQASLNCIWANEWDKYAGEIYQKRFPETPFSSKDIRTVNPSELPEFDLLCAGFPCQAFSIAGKRQGFNDTRGTLFFEIARILEARKPSLVLLENVKGLLSHDGGETFGVIIKALGELGYWVEWQVFNSKDFGVPQNRERVFIVGHFGERGGQEVFPIGESTEIPFKGRRTESIKGKYSSTITKSYSKGVHSGGETLICEPVLTPDREKKRQNGPRFKKDGEPSFTLIGQDIHGVKISEGIRRLTPLECERLQGFPDGWTLGLSDCQRYKCLGNAVTTNVITAIGERILRNTA
jgi:DNA (cytosine-5)-methyltransferase 1